MQATIDISKALQIPGWMSHGELLWLAKRASECERIVEFGSFHGRSTRALADNIKDGGRIWAVDPWSGDYPGIIPPVNTFCMPEFISNLSDHVSSGRVIPIRAYSHDFFLPEKVDMVFIDGDHRFMPVIRDIVKARSLIADDGIICGHDYNQPFPEVVDAVNKMFSDVEVEDTIWWTRKF